MLVSRLVDGSRTAVVLVGANKRVKTIAELGAGRRLMLSG